MTAPGMTSNKLCTVTWLPSFHATSAERLRIDLKDLAARLLAQLVILRNGRDWSHRKFYDEAKTRQPMLMFATLGDQADADSGSLKWGGNIIALTGATLDVDPGKMKPGVAAPTMEQVVARLRERGICGIVRESTGDRSCGAPYHVHLPFSRPMPMPKTEWQRRWRWVNRNVLDGVADTGAERPAQGFFCGKLEGRNDLADPVVIEGEFVDLVISEDELSPPEEKHAPEGNVGPNGWAGRTLSIPYISACLKHIDPNLAEPDWFKVVGGLMDASRGSEEGRELALAWSQGSTVKFDADAFEDGWRRLGTGKAEKRTTGRTLLWYAQQGEFPAASDAWDDLVPEPGWGWHEPITLNDVDAYPWVRAELEFDVIDLGEGGTADAPDNDNNEEQAPTDREPIDLWGSFDPPKFPHEILPPVLEAFAIERGAMMGCDPAGIAAAALTVCAAAIPDAIRVQVKRHDTGWKESARIWVGLIGDPSTKKSPIIRAAADPLTAIDLRRFHDFQQLREEFDTLPGDEKKRKPSPAQRRKRIEDTTVEAAQDVLLGSPEGVLCLQDELSGFFGAMDKYGGKGAAKDRAFWLQAFNGGPYAVNRVTRGSAIIPNLSVCLLGGIQPDPIRRLAGNATDDGLIQRLFPIILQPAGLGKDEPSTGNVVGDYEALVGRLVAMEALGSCLLHFTDCAQVIRREMEALHLGAAQGLEAVNRKLGAHAGKLDGLFARICVLFHCVEHASAPDLPTWINKDTARRVAVLMRRFLMPHAVAFYTTVIGVSDDHDRLTALASTILVHKLSRISVRDVARMSRGGSTRGLTTDEIERLFDQLAALAWVSPTVAYRTNASPACTVNPLVHQRFAERTERERARMELAREAIACAFAGEV